ncbi:MAG TPA: DinB family protein [Dehalococcoidia bacterium]|nr:DinB family protein [Dehalococcoidia bacterium]
MNADLAATLEAMRVSRAALVAVIEPLTAEDMAKSRPGGWSTGRVLHHVIESEVAYVKLLAHLRGLAAPDIAAVVPLDGKDALSQLARTRDVLLRMAEGIDDETLYRLAPLGSNEYSALSVLENDADHDHEHLAQVSRLIAGSVGA